MLPMHRQVRRPARIFARLLLTGFASVVLMGAVSESATAAPHDAGSVIVTPDNWGWE